MDLIVKTVVTMVRVGLKAESMFEDDVHRVGGQPKLGPVSDPQVSKIEIPGSFTRAHIGVMMRAYKAILFRSPL